jgi:dTDP-4-amino-4,6-dideoxygalactose transaminase
MRSFYRNAGFSEPTLPVTDYVADAIIRLPLYPDLTADEVRFICERLTGFFGM